MLEALKFLLEHADLIVLVEQAIEKGVSKEQLLAEVKKLMVEASDAEMKREYPAG